MNLGLEHVPRCLFCGAEGLWLHRDLRDPRYGAPGLYHLRKCPRCNLAWLDPRPDPASLSLCYKGYYTHLPISAGTEGPERRCLGYLRDCIRTAILCGHFGYRGNHGKHALCRLGALMGRVRFLRHRAAFDDLAERFPRFANGPDNLLIDVGCGRGDFLARMKTLGWNVLGIEPDPVSSDIARARGIPVFNGTLGDARLDGDTADEISMNHVLEHVYDPLSLLKECCRVLRPGGRLVLHIPNIASLGHRIFGRHWAALEPPRHFFHFSPRSIDAVLRLSPFRDYRIRTVDKISAGIYDTSVALRDDSLRGNTEAQRRRGRGLFRAMERYLCAAGLSVGEEIEVAAFK